MTRDQLSEINRVIEAMIKADGQPVMIPVSSTLLARLIDDSRTLEAIKEMLFEAGLLINDAYELGEKAHD